MYLSADEITGIGALNIFQVYQYFTIYRWHFSLKFENLESNKLNYG
jgi:hypothetical protein